MPDLMVDESKNDENRKDLGITFTMGMNGGYKCNGLGSRSTPSVWQVDKNLVAYKKYYCKASGYIYWKLPKIGKYLFKII